MGLNMSLKKKFVSDILGNKNVQGEKRFVFLLGGKKV